MSQRTENRAEGAVNIPQPDEPVRSQIAQIRARLTCDDARFWFDFQIKSAARNLLVTECSLAEYRNWAEAEGEVDCYQREKTRRRLAGLPETSRETRVVPAHTEIRDGVEFTVAEQTISALGSESLLRHALDRAARAREKNGFNPLDITRIRTLRQKDMWDESPQGHANAIISGLMDMARNTAMSPAVEASEPIEETQSK